MSGASHSEVMTEVLLLSCVLCTTLSNTDRYALVLAGVCRVGGCETDRIQARLLQRKNSIACWEEGITSEFSLNWTLHLSSGMCS